MKTKILLLALLVGGFLFHGSGWASENETKRPMIERVRLVKKTAHKETKNKIKSKKAKAHKKAHKKAKKAKSRLKKSKKKKKTS